MFLDLSCKYEEQRTAQRSATFRRSLLLSFLHITNLAYLKGILSRSIILCVRVCMHVNVCVRVNVCVCECECVCACEYV